MYIRIYVRNSTFYDLALEEEDHHQIRNPEILGFTTTKYFTNNQFQTKFRTFKTELDNLRNYCETSKTTETLFLDLMSSVEASHNSYK